jgi:hypothetical protein
VGKDRIRHPATISAFGRVLTLVLR